MGMVKSFLIKIQISGVLYFESESGNYTTNGD